MPRKPFELFSFMVHGVPSQDMVMVEEANAAIAQDKEYALRRIREENHEGMIYYRERDEARAERDHFQNENTALREENKRLKERLEKSESRRTHWDAVTLTNYEFTKTQLAEAVKMIERIFEICDETDELNGKRLAREFLAKVKS